jgi:hypothetical protein
MFGERPVCHAKAEPHLPANRRSTFGQLIEREHAGFAGAVLL